MKLLHNLPIKRKLLLVMLVTCGAVLAFACGALFWFQSVQFRKGFVAELESLSAIIAQNSSAPLAFGDKKSAAEVLSALKVKPYITSARVFDADGKLFAHFGHEDDNSEASAPGFGVRFSEGYASLTYPIPLEDGKSGHLKIRALMRDKYHKLLGLYAGVLAAVVIASLIIILLLSSVLQRIITGPIVKLAEIAGDIAARKDYSARATVVGQDEVGRLTTAFNEMLVQIQRQDGALNQSRQKMQSLIDSIDGIVWEWSPLDRAFTFVSPQSKRLLGYPPECWIGNQDFWDQIVHPDDLEAATQACADATARRQPYSYEYRMIAADKRVVWIRESGVVMVEYDQAVAFRGIFIDITEQKRAAKELASLNEQISHTQRQAGMAEIATNVLHNVGNVLNSVNVSASLLHDQLCKSQVNNLLKATNLLRDHAADTAAFLTNDPKGQRLPGFLIKLGDHLASEQRAWRQELEGLGKNIEHIKEIVSMQQTYARAGGFNEFLDTRDLVEDALRINEARFINHGITLVRDFNTVPHVEMDRHKTLQILVNLIGNAKHALEHSGEPKKILTLTILQSDDDHVSIQVRDNGMGIPPENLTHIFQHGFTTKKDGHGFGLHSSANAAREMGGKLFAHSDGIGHGATFTLELPAPKTKQLVTP